MTTDRSGASRREALRAASALGTGVLAGSVGVGRRPSRRTGERGKGGGSAGSGTDGDVAGSRSFRRRTRVGIHAGSGIDAVERTDRIESWVGSGFDAQNVFVPFDDAGYEMEGLFDRVLPAIWASGRTPMLTWEPYLTSGRTPADVAGRIAAGEYDEYLATWGRRMREALWTGATEQTERAKKADRGNEPAAYVRLAHEANGNWYPWAPAGGRSSPAEYKRMWRHVRSRVERELGAGARSRLEWVWAVNGVDVGPYSMEELYPGDTFVDWLGVDNYNWGTSQPWSEWRSPANLLVSPVERVRKVPSGDLPIGVTEFASSSATGRGYDVDRKAAWIEAAFGALDRADVDMAIWFNRDRKTDWAVFDGARGTDRIEGRDGELNAYSAYRNGVLGHRR